MKASIVINFALFGVIGCQSNSNNLAKLNSDTLNTSQIDIKKESYYSSINRIDSGYQKIDGDSISFAKFRLNENDTVQWHRMDSTIFHYRDYDVSKVSMDGEVGEEIWIFCHKNKELFSINRLFNLGATYFGGIVDGKLIIDEGTTATRGLYVLNLLTKKIILDATHDEIEIKNNEIKFLGIVKGQQSQTITCQQGELYEEFIFNLKNNSLSKTGKYKCIVGE